MSISTISANSAYASAAPANSRSGLPLTPEQQQRVADLQATDRDVRAHEQAHLAAAAGLATGGASYTYEQGPDGKRYAVAGEVPISLSSGDTPQQTIARARQAQKAALAPADPSAQDRKVAAEAAQMAAKAEAQLHQQQMQTATPHRHDSNDGTYDASGVQKTSPPSGGNVINTYA